MNTELTSYFAMGMNRQETYEPTILERDLSPILSLVELLNDMEEASSVELITEDGGEFTLLYRNSTPTPQRIAESSTTKPSLINISTIGILCVWAKVYGYTVRLEYDPFSCSESVIAAHMTENDKQYNIHKFYVMDSNTTDKKPYPSTEEIIEEIESLYELPPIDGGTEKQIAYARAIRAKSIRNYRHYVSDRCYRKYPDEESRLAELKKTAIAYFEGMTAKQIIDVCCSLDGGAARRKGKYITFNNGQA